MRTEMGLQEKMKGESPFAAAEENFALFIALGRPAPLPFPFLRAGSVQSVF